MSLTEAILGAQHTMRTASGPTLWPFLCVVLFFSGTLIAFLIRRSFKGPYVDAEITQRGGRVLLPDALWEYWFWTTHPMERALLAVHATPNAITVVSLFLSIAGGLCFAFGEIGFGGWLYMFGGTFDVFDGRLARATGRSSRAGAFLDSNLDRWGEAAVLLGLAIFFNGGRGAPLSGFALVTSLMVSYTKARGESLGVACGEGGMQRAERIVYLGLSCVFAPLVEMTWSGHGAWLVESIVGLIGVSSLVTAIRRTVLIYRALRSPAATQALEGKAWPASRVPQRMPFRAPGPVA